MTGRTPATVRSAASRSGVRVSTTRPPTASRTSTATAPPWPRVPSSGVPTAAPSQPPAACSSLDRVARTRGCRPSTWASPATASTSRRGADGDVGAPAVGPLVVTRAARPAPAGRSARRRRRRARGGGRSAASRRRWPTGRRGRGRRAHRPGVDAEARDDGHRQQHQAGDVVGVVAEHPGRRAEGAGRQGGRRLPAGRGLPASMSTSHRVPTTPRAAGATRCGSSDPTRSSRADPPERERDVEREPWRVLTTATKLPAASCATSASAGRRRRGAATPDARADDGRRSHAHGGSLLVRGRPRPAVVPWTRPPQYRRRRGRAHRPHLPRGRRPGGRRVVRPARLHGDRRAPVRARLPAVPVPPTRRRRVVAPVRARGRRPARHARVPLRRRRRRGGRRVRRPRHRRSRGPARSSSPTPTATGCGSASRRRAREPRARHGRRHRGQLGHRRRDRPGAGGRRLGRRRRRPPASTASTRSPTRSAPPPTRSTSPIPRRSMPSSPRCPTAGCS